MASTLRIAGLTVCTLLSACDSIKEDKFMSQGGISPDPSAVLSGSVLYVGPKPTCLYKSDGSVDRVQGKVVMTMFEYDNPPPPEGNATTAANLFFLSGDELFATSDCLPQGATPNFTDRITRSVAFVWSGVVLDPARAIDYQIRGFYDYDEDMNPLFSVTRLPTAGDIAGGAVNDISAPEKGFFKISLPKQADAKDGVEIDGLTVAYANPVWSERPAFALDANHALSATAAFTPAIGISATGDITPSGPQSLRNFRALTCASGATDGSKCGLTLQRLGADVAPQLAASKIGLDLTNPDYAFFAEPVDVETVVVKAADDTSMAGGLDVKVPDGKVDPHPLLGAGLGVPWYYPVVLLQRQPDAASVAIEAAARIPAVLLVGSVLLGDDDLPSKSNYAESGAPIAIPPVAAVELIPGHPECRVPYFAPGTSNLVTDGRLANCDELPTGRYAVNVLAGLQGGMPTISSDYPTHADSPFAVTGAGYSGQSWTVPNELGDAAQVGAANVIASQSTSGTFVIQDPTPDKAACVKSTLQGKCAAGPEIIENAAGVDSTLCLLGACCDYVAHLCGLPTCEKVASADGNIAASPTMIMGNAANGAAIPNCVPFELPWQCCAAAP